MWRLNSYLFEDYSTETPEQSGFVLSGTPLAFVDRTSETESERIQTAVREYSNHVLVARFDRDIDKITGHVLIALSLPYLRRATPTYIQFLRDPRNVAFELMEACATSPALAQGYVYGRLDMWQSLGGLAGTADGASFEEVAATVRNCQWVSFRTPSDYFESILGTVFAVACLRPDHRTLAVLYAWFED